MKERKRLKTAKLPFEVASLRAKERIHRDIVEKRSKTIAGKRREYII